MIIIFDLTSVYNLHLFIKIAFCPPFIIILVISKNNEMSHKFKRKHKFKCGLM